jgi:hypothetical protein
VDEVERQVILATLEQLKGDKKLAAQVLGISLKDALQPLSVCNAATQATATRSFRPDPGPPRRSVCQRRCASTGRFAGAELCRSSFTGCRCVGSARGQCRKSVALQASDKRSR